jgi:DNA-binding NarL/FixJ family response regulator
MREGAQIQLVTGMQPPAEYNASMAELFLVKPDDEVGTGSSQRIRVLVANGQSLVGSALHALLESQEDIAVVASACDGETVASLARRMRPDVLLMDTTLHGIDGMEILRRIAADAQESEVNVLVLAGHEADEFVFGALRAGVSGFLLKDSGATELFHAVRAVAAGEPVLAPGVARRLIAEVASRPQPVAPDEELVEQLTTREREVVALVALGLSNEEIAHRLVVSPATARTHVSRAMVKLHARDRAQLVVFAHEAGLAR